MIPLLESVINISTCDVSFLNECISRINTHSQVAMLDIHRGISVRRSVLTICGTPKALIDALFSLIKMCQQKIDMRTHVGTHPRIGAVDVCPIIPIRGISFEEAEKYTAVLAEKVANQLNIPIYLYEKSARTAKRTFLYNIRRGEYEGLREKMTNPHWIPDEGPKQWSVSVAKSGAMVLGVRDIMVAWNLSLKTNNTKLARMVSARIRGTGRIHKGIRIPGHFSSVRAIGWSIPEYSCAQVSLNIYNIHQDKMSDIFHFAQQHSHQSIHHTERIGLIPLSAIGLNPDASVDDVKRVTKHLKIKHFEPKHHILEYTIRHRCDDLNFTKDYPCLNFSP